MTDLVSAWSRVFAAGVEMQPTWLRGLETVQASGTVIGDGTDRMRDSASAPLTADVAEFARMVPEKVEAFSRSADAIARDSMLMHAAWATQMQRVGAITAGAKLGRGALAPVHRTATGNVRRLKRTTAK